MMSKLDIIFFFNFIILVSCPIIFEFLKNHLDKTEQAESISLCQNKK